LPFIAITNIDPWIVFLHRDNFGELFLGANLAQNGMTAVPPPIFGEEELEVSQAEPLVGIRKPRYNHRVTSKSHR